MNQSHFKRARSLDPATSHAAADQAQDLARQHFNLIVHCLQRFGPLGKDGISYLIGLNGHQVGKRLPELQKMGYIELTGRTTKSKSGRNEREWGLVCKTN